MPVTDPESLNFLRNGDLVQIPGGLHVATFGQIRPMICSRIERGIHWISTYGIGLVADGHVLGALVMFKCSEGPIERPDTLTAYTRISALALRNWLAEKKPTM